MIASMLPSDVLFPLPGRLDVLRMHRPARPSPLPGAARVRRHAEGDGDAAGCVDREQRGHGRAREGQVQRWCIQCRIVSDRHRLDVQLPHRLRLQPLAGPHPGPDKSRVIGIVVPGDRVTDTCRVSAGCGFKQGDIL